MSDFVKPAIDDVIISIEPGDHQFPVAPMVANYINQLQRENRKYQDLCEEAWNVLVTANLSPSDARAALSRLDRRLREAGIKRFPPVAVAKGLPESPK